MWIFKWKKIGKYKRYDEEGNLILDAEYLDGNLMGDVKNIVKMES